MISFQQTRPKLANQNFEIAYQAGHKPPGLKFKDQSGKDSLTYCGQEGVFFTKNRKGSWQLITWSKEFHHCPLSDNNTKGKTKCDVFSISEGKHFPPNASLHMEPM